MMKPLIVLGLLFLISSCEKYTFPAMPEDPLWLEERISEIKAGTNYGIKIDVYLWKEEYFYHINNIISSCLFCNFFRYDGGKYVWGESEMQDFFTNAVFIGTTWSSPPY